MMATKYEEEVVEVDGDKVFLGIEIKLPDADCIYQLVGCRPKIYPHIMKSNTCKGVCYLILEPTVGKGCGNCSCI